MATLETLYGPSSVSTQTPGIDLPAFTSPKAVDLSPLAALFFARRREQEQARRPQVNMIQSRALAPQAEQSPWGGPMRDSALEDQAKSEAMRRSIIENAQATRTAPVRMMHGPGVVPGLTMDPLSMNAAQREAFLPKESSFYDPEAEGRGKARYEAEQRQAGETSRAGRSAAASGKSPQEQQASAYEQRVRSLRALGFNAAEIGKIMSGG